MALNITCQSVNSSWGPILVEFLPFVDLIGCLKLGAVFKLFLACI